MINDNKGYIYIRIHESYDKYDVCKLGKTNNILERDTTYTTGEIKRGRFLLVFEICDIYNTIDSVEKLLHKEFVSYNFVIDGGREFYNKEIIDKIEPFFNEMNILYRKLSDDEIEELVRCDRKNTALIAIEETVEEKQEAIEYYYTPRDYQEIIIQKSVDYFANNDKGILVLMCGVGKTLISLWISQRLNSSTILIGVPNITLLGQWENTIKVLFGTIPYLIVSNNIKSDDIVQFLENHRNNCIVITTYHSSGKILKAVEKIKYVFSMKINDEVHHLATSNLEVNPEKKKFANMLSIPFTKQISLTATIKNLENINNINPDNIIVSNNDIAYFGDIIDRKCLLEAINENIVCDYQIQTIITDEEQMDIHLRTFNIEIENHKRLFLSAYLSLKSIRTVNSQRLLIYSNSRENSRQIIIYIKELLKNNYFPELKRIYCSEYDSSMKEPKRKEILDNFKREEKGIISCVYCLGEGWDFPLLDGVVFAENMSSDIRIVQSALRASRKNIEKPGKISKIILPIYKDNGNLFDDENSPDFRKVREIIYRMGLEDETIIQKITVVKINIQKHEFYNNNRTTENIGETFGEYDDKLTEKLKMRTISRVALDITYEKARKIIGGKNIKNKEEYYALCDKDCRLSKEPDVIFKGKFTNWIDYLSIERVYYDLDTCKNKICEYLKLYPELKVYYPFDLNTICYELCKIDPLFPPLNLWVDYYDVENLSCLIHVKITKKKVRNIV